MAPSETLVYHLKRQLNFTGVVWIVAMTDEPIKGAHPRQPPIGGTEKIKPSFPEVAADVQGGLGFDGR